MTFLRIKLPFVMLVFASAPLGAEEICRIQASVRCSCPASMLIACQSGRTGFVDDTQRARSISVSITKAGTGEAQIVVLDNPPSGSRSYYGNLNEDPWVAAQLSAQGVTNPDGLILNVKSIRFDDDVVLYDNPHENVTSNED